MFKKSSKELWKKVCKEGSEKLGKRVCKKVANNYAIVHAGQLAKN